jgi:threonine dehydrogenase-like Zn-dependent dehydrogenase
MMVPNDIPLKAAALTEPFVIAARGANSQLPESGQSVTVFGAGTIGIAAAIMLKWYGAGKILIVDVSEKRLKVAEQFGLITCNSATEDLKAKAIETFGSARGLAGEVSDCELYVDCVGMQPILDNFQQLAKPCAKLTVVGVYHAPATINMMWVCYSTWTIRGCGTKSLEELFPDVIAMMQSGKFDISTLISHEYNIEDVDAAFQKAFDSQEALKVAISYI